MADSLENGAGYCRWIAVPENFIQIMSKLTVEQPGDISVQLLGQHGHDCDTSCNRCLRDFYNLPYHGVLDWRLGLDMARLANEQAAPIDLHSPWGSNPNPWQQLFNGPHTPITASLSQLGYSLVGQMSGLPAYVSEERALIRLLVHPLWTDHHQAIVSARIVANAQFPGFAITTMNPFRALRRVIDYL
jgi:hypothetical protein